MKREFIQSLLEVVPGGCIIYQIKKRSLHVIDFTEEFAEVLGYKKDELKTILEKNPFESVYIEDRSVLENEIVKCIDKMECLKSSFRIINKQGEIFWVHCRGKIIGKFDKNPLFIITIQNASLSEGKILHNADRENLINTVNTLINTQKELVYSNYKLEKAIHDKEYLLTHDSLTGIYNREKTFLECRHLMESHPKEQFCIVHFDIQKFRLFNSFYGEEEGDKLLIYIANMFRELHHEHAYGVYGRIEADVFLLFFPYQEKVIARNQEIIHEKLVSYREDFYVNGACGVYITGEKRLSIEAMFNRAALASKNNQKKLMCTVTFFDDEMEECLKQEQEIAEQMQQALKNEEFVVFLQPKYRTVSGKPVGAEALVRWNHPQKGLISPAKFIPLFERNGFISKLDQYVWTHTCQLIRTWLNQGKNPGPISVNVSQISMHSPKTVNFLKNLVETYQIPLELFYLELTESAYMDDPDEMKDRLMQLREYGFKMMMDDFGSGYSSLNMLKNLPVDFLKVDRMFLASVDKDRTSRLLLSSIMHMASQLNIPVITEGVETEEQRAFLLSVGSDYIQGYLYARPMPADEYEANIMPSTDVSLISICEDQSVAKL